MLTNSQGVRINPPYFTGTVRHPDNIEQLWTDAQLNAIGLYRAADPQPEPTPPPSAPPEVPISRRQFYQALAMMDPPVITADEAYAAAANGVIPPAFLTLIDGMTGPDGQPAPDEVKFGAKMLLGAGMDFYRSNPLTTTLAQAQGWTDAQVDALFAAARTL